MSIGYFNLENRILPIPSYQNIPSISNIGIISQYRQRDDYIYDSSIFEPGYLNFLWFWFNRLILYPQNINLGIITKLTSREFRIWNTYLEDAFLTEIKLYEIGIAFNIGIGDRIPLNNTLLGIVYVDVKGSKFILADEHIHFYTTLGNSCILILNALRGLVFPITPFNYNNLKVSFIFETNILTTTKVKEQRLSLISTPIITLEGKITLKDYQTKKYFFTKDYINFVYLFPYLPETFTLYNNVSIGATEIRVNQNLNQFYKVTLTKYILIIDLKSEEYQVGVIKNINYTTNTFTLEYPVAFDLKKPFVYIIPLIPVKIENINMELASTNIYQISYKVSELQITDKLIT